MRIVLADEIQKTCYFNQIDVKTVLKELIFFMTVPIGVKAKPGGSSTAFDEARTQEVETRLLSLRSERKYIWC